MILKYFSFRQLLIAHEECCYSHVSKYTEISKHIAFAAETNAPHSCPKHVVIGKKISSQSNDKFVNYSQQTTIFH